MIKATVTEVKIGNIAIEGLMNENGQFGIAIPQLAGYFQFSSKHASRILKPMLSEGFLKWQTSLNPKAVNVVPLNQMESVIFYLAQKNNKKAIEIWNQIHPNTMFTDSSTISKKRKIESLVEDFVIELMYQDSNPRRQVITDFGIADVVHDYGVVEIKEFKSIRSAHLAMGQAMSYGAILNKRPEVLLFNVPESSNIKILDMFTAVEMLVWIYSKRDTKKMLARKQCYPTCSNATKINVD